MKQRHTPHVAGAAPSVRLPPEGLEREVVVHERANVNLVLAGAYAESVAGSTQVLPPAHTSHTPRLDWW